MIQRGFLTISSEILPIVDANDGLLATSEGQPNLVPCGEERVPQIWLERLALLGRRRCCPRSGGSLCWFRISCCLGSCIVISGK